MGERLIMGVWRECGRGKAYGGSNAGTVLFYDQVRSCHSALRTEPETAQMLQILWSLSTGIYGSLPSYARASLGKSQDEG